MDSNESSNYPVHHIVGYNVEPCYGLGTCLPETLGKYDLGSETECSPW